MLEQDSVLVVDDSRVMREMLRTLLERHCRSLLSATSCGEALAALATQKDLQLVLCDVVLRDGNGFEVLERIAASPQPRPAVILMTARFVPADAERAEALGAIGYLTKPVSLRDIRSCRDGPDALAVGS